MFLDVRLWESMGILDRLSIYLYCFGIITLNTHTHKAEVEGKYKMLMIGHLRYLDYSFSLFPSTTTITTSSLASLLPISTTTQNTWRTLHQYHYI